MLTRTRRPRFDPLVPEFRRDPYPFYHRYRQEDPVHLGRPAGPRFPSCTYLFRYDDVRLMLTDDRFQRERGSRGRSVNEVAPDLGPSELIALAVRNALLFQDPPAHARMRALVGRAFLSVAHDLGSRVERIASDLLDELPATDAFDLIDRFAVLLPVSVMADAMALPRADWAIFKRWSTELIALLDVQVDGRGPAVAARAAAQITEYLRGIIESRQSAPGDDLISRLITVEQDGARLSAAEVLSNCILLLVAGYENTVCGIGNGVRALLSRPDQSRLLRMRPELLPSAVEEFLRFESPVQMIFRVCVQDAVLRGVEIPEGSVILGAVGAANRDPDEFAKPDELDITRSPNRHLAFGAGRHFCLGARLARAEIRHAIKLLFERMPKLTLAGEPAEPLDSIIFRGLKSLRVQP